MNNQNNTIIDEIITIAQDKKCEDIRQIKIHDPHWITDNILLITAKNSVHSKSLITSLKDFVKKNNATYQENNIIPIGTPESGWVILDFSDSIVHVLLDETRAHYKLDALFEEKGDVYHH